MLRRHCRRRLHRHYIIGGHIERELRTAPDDTFRTSRLKLALATTELKIAIYETLLGKRYNA